MTRLDVWLADHGLAESREKAQALVMAGRVGASIAAELGTMRVTEQIDALETMDIDPIRYLVSPRIAAALISFPLLTALFDVVGILGGYLTGSVLLGLNPGLYFTRVESSVALVDVTGGFIKSLVFAVIVVSICCYQGYFTHTRAEGFGAKGVSLSTTSAVVISSTRRDTKRPRPWITCTPPFLNRSSTPPTRRLTTRALRAWIAGQSGVTLPSSFRPKDLALPKAR